jgi:hypothetical protein
LTKLYANSTKKFLTKIQIRTSHKLQPNFESETVTIPKFEIRILQNLFFLGKKKISLETLASMLITQSGKFQNFEFESLAGISSNSWQTKIEEIKFTVSFTVLACSKPVAMLLDTSAVDPGALCPDPSRATWEERKTAPGPPSLLLLPLCKFPTTVPSPESTHSPPRPRQQTPARP